MKNTLHNAHVLCAFAGLALFVSACKDNPEAKDTKTDAPSYASTYAPRPSQTIFIQNAHIIDGIGGELTGSIFIENGKISNVGTFKIEVPDGTHVIDAKGAYVTPGIIDVHTHMGVYAVPSVKAHWDGNDATSPNTAQVRAEHGIWPQDPAFAEALAGGVTTAHVLPGSANLFGGVGVTVRTLPARTVQSMKFPEAPSTLKMACGENPKNVYRNKGGPASRMGNFAGYRENWIEAQGYKKKLDAGEIEEGDRDLQLETLAGVLSGDIRVQMHCYRADEMVQVLDMAKEFGYKVSAFHHAVEAYKIADYLKENDVCAAMWSDWWGFKMESYDGIRENVPFVHARGACAIVHSDDNTNIQRLNQEAAKAWAHGNRVGLKISKAEAFKWITSNPAKAIGIDDQTGSLETGKRADFIIWSGDPFSSYGKPDQVYVDGALVIDRASGLKPVSDFKLGQPGTGE